MIPVMTKDGKAILLDYRQIIYIERNKRGFIYHTRTDVYKPITALDQLAEALKPIGFDLLHQSNAVNLTNISNYNQELDAVYFDKKITRQSKSAMVSRENRTKINIYVKEHPEIDVLYHKQ